MSKQPILTPFLDDIDVILYAGDCIEVMMQMPEASVDAIVTDPPYGLEFMGRDWDGFGTPLGFQTWTESWAREALRILKPGGHLLAFAGTRTYHRMASGVEDAGFEIRDCIAWMYGSGFPKSLDVSKAIDKAAGAERDRYERSAFGGNFSDDNGTTYGTAIDNTAITSEAEAWNGWGTALKPAYEPIVVARKPLIGTVAANVLEHGTGALNIDACRIDMGDEYDPAKMQRQQRSDGSVQFGSAGLIGSEISTYKPAGRWPANVALDATAAAMLDEQSGQTSYNPIGTFGKQRGDQRPDTAAAFAVRKDGDGVFGYGDTGGASRFFYTAKASRHDRNAGGLADNTHPTVKPTELMRWLIRLVTPPGGIILDPFGGSGSTGLAARAENTRCILIEREPEYLQIIRDRLSQLNLFTEENQ
jgi:site-specific DNA-methyltransferase (adenine-specific)